LLLIPIGIFHRSEFDQASMCSCLHIL